MQYHHIMAALMAGQSVTLHAMTAGEFRQLLTMLKEGTA